MNKFLKVFALLILGISFQTCKDDNIPKPDCNSSQIRIQAKAFFGNDPLVLFSDYDYPQGFKVKITRADFMIQGLAFEGNNTTLNYKDSVFVIQFTEDNIEKAKQGQTILFNGCEGNFSKLRLNIGVDQETNKKNPSDFPQGHPLANAFYYWDAWKSYIFMKLEGKYDQDGDGNFEGNFAYHIGTDLLNKYSLPLTFNPAPGKPNSIDLNFDVKRILASEIDFVDIPQHPASHNPGDVEVANKIFENLAKAVSIK